MHPKHNFETFNPVLPSLTYSIAGCETNKTPESLLRCLVFCLFFAGESVQSDQGCQQASCVPIVKLLNVEDRISRSVAGMYCSVAGGQVFGATFAFQKKPL